MREKYLGQDRIGLLTIGGFGLLSILLGGLFTSHGDEIIYGLKAIMTHHSLLGTDYIAIGGLPGVSFIHAGVLLCIALGIVILTKTKLHGNTIGALFMVYGYAFFGKSFYNIWPPLIGVYIYGMTKKLKASDMTPSALYATSLGPLVSALTFSLPFEVDNYLLLFFISWIFGMLAGFFMAAILARGRALHHNLIVYNAGFAAGITLLWVNGVLKALGIDVMTYYVESPPNASTKAMLLLKMGVLFVYLIIVGYAMAKRYDGDLKVLTCMCKLGDQTEAKGLGPVLMNIGIMGLLGLIYVGILPDIVITGQVFAAIFTWAAFGGMGLSLKSSLPVFGGVFIAAVVLGGVYGLLHGQSFFVGAYERLCRPDMVFAAMAAQGMGPVTATYGYGAGVLAGALHVVIVPSISFLHGKMLVYNHGFCTGLVTTFFEPAFRRLAKEQIDEN